MLTIYNLSVTLVNYYSFIMLLACIYVNLIDFGIVNDRHVWFNKIGYFLLCLTEPVLRPIRNILPMPGGFDFSPMVAIFILQFIPSLIGSVFLGF